MTYADITLTHASVNGGTAVYLQGINVTAGYGNMVRANPVEGKYDITEADIGGFGENPIFTVEAVVDVTDIPSNTITQAFALDFKQVKSPITMEIICGSYSATPTLNQRFRGRPANGYSLGATLSNTINVVLKSVSVSFNANENIGGVWHYSLTFMETT